ncbi:MAG: hypothetical protein JW725_05600 [Candidatus Babeliaceae bacterium]|nr:hypothetical protein [Candidatus Babeliaceae bacterium]
MRRLFTAILLLCLLSGCATGELMSRLRPGMSKSEVTNILGNPDGYQARGEYEAMKYSHRLVTGWAWDRADYYVILKDQKVVEYGTGEVRVKDVNSNVLFLVPLR